MPATSDWKIPAAAQPKPQDYSYDLDAALTAMVSLRATMPPDAFTAEVLGTDRSGNGVLIGDGIVLTIGYLITEAQEVWLTLHDGKVVPAHPLGYDQNTGFGLVQALSKIDAHTLAFDQSSSAKIGESVVLAGAGGRAQSVAARIVAKQQFAGYWEYVLDEAIFTAPSHPHWGGTALIGPAGDLLGIGSLQLEQADANGPRHLNMVVPIDLLKPIYSDMVKFGRSQQPARPWLGLYATAVDDKIVVMGLATGGPASRAGLQTGDLILEVAGKPVDVLAQFFQAIWALGDAGAEVPLKLWREGDIFDVQVRSGDRNKFLKGPKVH